MKSVGLYFLAVTGLFAQTTGATFEVATVKASPPPIGGGFVRGCKGGPGTDDPGLWRCTNATVTMLILRGYDIKNYQLTAPDWMGNTNYEITAKLPPGTTKEQFREMIQNLLSERFKLEFHWSKKEMPMYDLIVAKGGPKLTEWVEKPAADAKGDAPGSGKGGRGPESDADGYPIVPANCNGCMYMNGAGKARYHISKGSVKSLADTLAGQLRMPVSDQTGLTGTYDITLSWNDGGGVSRRTDANEAADPGISMEAAVQQQLGLKLVSKRGPVDIIIADKAERNPAEN